MEHDCIIGLFYDVDTDRLVTFGGVYYLTEKYRELQSLYRLDPIYSTIYHGKRYEFRDYFDRRKSVNMKRFEFCPMCGKKIDWTIMRKEADKMSEGEE